MRIKQSRYWWFEKDLKWMLDNRKSIFISNRENKFVIITKVDHDGYNYFKICNDRYGILINALSKYEDDSWKNEIKEEGSIIGLPFFQYWAREYLADEFIDPVPDILNFFRIKKDKIISV